MNYQEIKDQCSKALEGLRSTDRHWVLSPSRYAAFCVGSDGVPQWRIGIRPELYQDTRPEDAAAALKRYVHDYDVSPNGLSAQELRTLANLKFTVGAWMQGEVTALPASDYVLPKQEEGYGLAGAIGLADMAPHQARA